LRGFIGGQIGMAGVKVVGDFVGNYTRGLPSELGLLCLFDPETGAPVAVIDASGITEMRTGAGTAVGAQYLAPDRPRTLGHIGRADPPTGTCGSWTGYSASRRSGCIRGGLTAASDSPSACPASLASL